MNIQNEHVLKCLPLLASALGDKYGVQVAIGGSQAMTDGRTIYLPSLPITCEDTFIKVLRGYIDHESAHIRYSDFNAIKHANLTPFEKFIWNSIEDWRIEKKMGEHFTGCKANLHWLIYHVFYHENQEVNSLNLQDALTRWLLLTIRSWDKQELKLQVENLAKHINIKMKSPQLLTELGTLLIEVRNTCISSDDVYKHTKLIVDCIQKYINMLEEKLSAENNNTKGDENDSEENNNTESKQSQVPDMSDMSISENMPTDMSDRLEENLQEIISDLQDLCKSQELPENIGEQAKNMIEEGVKNDDNQNIHMAVEVKKQYPELLPEKIQKALRISASLKARLQGLLQAQSLVRHLPARSGIVNKNRLHALAVNDNRVFLQHAQKQETNVAIHILVDISSSMASLRKPIQTDNKVIIPETQIEIASQACFSLAKALESTKGINLGVTAFPVDVPYEVQDKFHENNIVGVCPLVKHGEKVSRNFKLEADGCTPLTEALWYTLSKLLPQKETRKIIILLTDGMPDEIETTISVVEQANKLGVEIYGIGISQSNIETILPHKSVFLNNVEQLPQTMFGLLQNALLKECHNS